MSIIESITWGHLTNTDANANANGSAGTAMHMGGPHTHGGGAAIADEVDRAKMILCDGKSLTRTQHPLTRTCAHPTAGMGRSAECARACVALSYFVLIATEPFCSSASGESAFTKTARCAQWPRAAPAAYLPRTHACCHGVPQWFTTSSCNNGYHACDGNHAAGNLSIETLNDLADHCRRRAIPLWFEPTSNAKSLRGVRAQSLLDAATYVTQHTVQLHRPHSRASGGCCLDYMCAVSTTSRNCPAPNKGVPVPPPFSPFCVPMGGVIVDSVRLVADQGTLERHHMRLTIPWCVRGPV